MQQQQTTMDGDDDHKTDWRGLVGAATRRTTITGSPVEKLAVDELLGLFFSAEKLASVHMTDKDMSILARYSWAISVPLASTPKTVVLQALKSPSLRRQYHTRMAGEYKLLMVEATLDRVLGLMVDLGVEDARVVGLEDLASVGIGEDKKGKEDACTEAQD